MGKIFDISEQDIEKSKKIYNGIFIKVLITTNHNINTIQDALKLKGKVLYYPENNQSNRDTKLFIEGLTRMSTEFTDEVTIVTESIDIIRDMVASNVRILTPDGEIIKPPIETFMGNVAEINNEIFNREDIPHFADRYVMELINEINSYDGMEMSNDVKLDFENRIEIIGDLFLKCALKEQLKN